jgi:hypothetical protein
MKAMKILFTVLVITTAIVGGFAFSTSANKYFSPNVFQYSGTRPATASSAIDPNSWTFVRFPSYTVPAVRLAAIEFDDNTYPLVSNKPDFAGQSTLRNTVLEKGSDPSNHLQTFNGIKFYFTEN